MLRPCYADRLDIYIKLDINMKIKREAAFHEAGHAIAAYRSKFHSLSRSINLKLYGAGEIFVTLSKSKLQAAGKLAAAASQTDKEVATDLAVVLCAGLVSERLAEEVSGLKADPDCAIPDHELMKQQLASAGLSKRFDHHEALAREVLNAEWSLVASLAEFLYENENTEAIDVIEFIQQHEKARADDAQPGSQQALRDKTAQRLLL